MSPRDDADRALIHPVLMQQRILDLEKHVENLDSKITKIETETDAAEKRRLKWGISALGSAIIALLGLVWALLPSDAQSAWEFFRGRSGP